MRLIDADEVVKFYKNMGKEFPELSVGTHFSISDIIQNLDNIPTVKKEKTMTMTNAEWLIKNGYSFYGLDCDDLEGEGMYYIFAGGTYIDKIKTDDSPLGAMLKWLDAEHKETILDDAEKQYLSAVIKPFRDKVKYIAKKNLACKEYIHIHVNADNIMLPCFKKGTMYKGMEPDRWYKLEELGL